VGARGRRGHLIHGHPPVGWKTPIPVCRDRIALELQYRLLLHVFAIECVDWSGAG